MIQIHLKKRDFITSTVVEYTTPDGDQIIKGKFNQPPKGYDPYNGWKAKLIIPPNPKIQKILASGQVIWEEKDT